MRLPHAPWPLWWSCCLSPLGRWRASLEALRQSDAVPAFRSTHLGCESQHLPITLVPEPTPFPLCHSSHKFHILQRIAWRRRPPGTRTHQPLAPTAHARTLSLTRPPWPWRKAAKTGPGSGSLPGGWNRSALPRRSSHVPAGHSRTPSNRNLFLGKRLLLVRWQRYFKKTGAYV